MPKEVSPNYYFIIFSLIKWLTLITSCNWLDNFCNLKKIILWKYIILISVKYGKPFELTKFLLDTLIHYFPFDENQKLNKCIVSLPSEINTTLIPICIHFWLEDSFWVLNLDEDSYINIWLFYRVSSLVGKVGFWSDDDFVVGKVRK